MLEKQLSTPFEKSMHVAALDMLEHSELFKKRWWRPRYVLGISHNKDTGVSLLHYEGDTDMFGRVVIHVQFNGVDEQANTFEVSWQIVFAARSGVTTYGKNPPAKIVWEETGISREF